MDSFYFINILKNIPASLFWKDKNGCYLGCNNFQAKLANLASPEQIIGKTDYDLPWYESADVLQAADKRIMESGISEELIETVKLPNGKEIIMFSSKSPFYDEQGNIIGIIGAALDITTLKKLEGLKDSAREKFAQIYLDNILKNVPGSVYWKDRDGVFLGCNDSQAKMAGFNSPTEMIGKTNYDLPWRESADAFKATDERIMATGISEQLVEVGKLADGTEPIMLSNKAPLYDDQGNIIGIIGTSLDITALKEAEKQKELALEKAAIAQQKAEIEEETRQTIMVFAGSIAHDLRTPLATVNLMGGYMKKFLGDLVTTYELAQKANVPDLPKIEKFDPESLLATPDDIRRKVNDMNIFIDETLKSLSRAVTGSLTTEDLVLCKSGKCIRSAIDAYPFEKGERELVQSNCEHIFTFSGNPVLIMRMIFNLIKNALYQIHKNGQGKIIISTKEDGDFNAICIKDTAGGASAETINSFFDGYKTTKQNGTGIGLAFCKLTMKSFGGDITCEAAEDDAIEFILRFPKPKPQ